MPLTPPAAILDRLKAHSAELDRRAEPARRAERYRDNEHALSPATREKAKEQNGVWSLLSDLALENYGGMIVDASLDDLEQIGYRWGNKDAEKQAWEIHQRNYLDSEGRLTMDTALTCGRGFEIIWDENGDGLAEISVESPLNVVVEYEPGSRHRRRAATRRWQEEDGRWYATLFTPDELWKFVGPAKHTADNPPTDWEAHEVEDEPWPLPNPLGVVPVVEHAVNRRLRVGKAHQWRFGVAAGDFEHHYGLIDRIHFTTFCGLAGLSWAGFQTLALFGVPHQFKKDEDGNDTNELVAPFEYGPGAIIQFAQNRQDASLETVSSDDAKAFIDHASAYVARLGAVSRTQPYKMGTTQIVNVGAEGIRLLNDSHDAKCAGYAVSLGEAREESIRIALAVEGNAEAAAYDRAEVIWRDNEITTLAATADALAKFIGSGMPWEIAAERVLKMSPTEIADTQSLVAAGQLAAGAANPQPPA